MPSYDRNIVPNLLARTLETTNLCGWWVVVVLALAPAQPITSMDRLGRLRLIYPTVCHTVIYPLKYRFGAVVMRPLVMRRSLGRCGNAVYN
jgi:hypothetical protein